MSDTIQLLQRDLNMARKKIHKLEKNSRDSNRGGVSTAKRVRDTLWFICEYMREYNNMRDDIREHINTTKITLFEFQKYLDMKLNEDNKRKDDLML